MGETAGCTASRSGGPRPLVLAIWIAFGVLALEWPGTLADLWAWVQGLPLAAEVVLWIVTLPWMTALALLESSWDPALQIALIALIAVVTSLPSAPRGGGRPGRVHWEVGPGEPHAST